MRKLNPVTQYQVFCAAHRPAEENEPRHRHAVRTAGETRLVGEDDGEEEPEAQRGDREIMSLQAQDRAADDERDAARTARRPR